MTETEAKWASHHLHVRPSQRLRLTVELWEKADGDTPIEQRPAIHYSSDWDFDHQTVDNLHLTVQAGRTRVTCNYDSQTEQTAAPCSDSSLASFRYPWYPSTMGIRKPKARAEQTEENGRRLLEAGRAVFAKRGYHGATLDQVARAAGLTKGAVYARFDSKADLFLALLAERIDARVAELRALPEPSSPEQAADDIFRQWLERSRDPAWTLLVLEFRVAAARDRSLNARYAALHRRVIDAVAERIVTATRISGTALSRDPATVAEVGLALANGLLLERAVTSDPDELDRATVDANRGLVSALAGARGGASATRRVR